jgi:hypothetical protein
MSKAIAISFFLCISSVCFAADETKEPPREYFLQIDGKAYTLEPDKDYRIPGAYNNPTVKLKVGASRTFNCRGLTFQYPASFSWDPPANQETAWTLSGSDCKITVLVSNRPVTLEGYVNSMVMQFRKINAQPIVEDFSRRLGARVYRGKTLKVKQTAKFRFEFYALPTLKGVRFLIIQDKVPPNKDMSSDAKKVIEMLTKTFRVTSE